MAPLCAMDLMNKQLMSVMRTKWR